MSTFNFHLQSLLRLRQARRDEARLHLADLLRGEGLLSAELAQFDSVVALARQNSGIVAPGYVDFCTRRELEQYERGVRRQREAIRNRRHVLEVEIELGREALAVAQRELRLLEELARREAADHEVDCDRVAQREVDELFAARRQADSDPRVHRAI